jgi:hypothetical protein
MYSNRYVKQEYLDSNIYTKDRIEFRIPKGERPLSNMRLVNLGCTSGTGGSIAHLNHTIGAAALLNSVTLYDGSKVLSQTLHFNRKYAHKVYSTTNSKNDSMLNNQLSSQFGFRFVTQSSGQYDFFKYVDSPGGDVGLLVTNDPSDTAQGMLDLSEALPLLNKLTMLDPLVFKDGLRIVIEFETKPHIVLDNVAATNATFQTLQPVLVYDNIIDDDYYKSLKYSPVVHWFETEHDQMLFPGESSVTKRSNAFNGKKIQRLAVSKVYQDKSKYVDGTSAVASGSELSSLALYNEKFQCILNGRQVLPGDGVYGQHKTRCHIDAYGDSCGYFGANLPWDTIANTPNFDLVLNRVTAQPGFLDYDGVVFNQEQCNDLQIQIKRDIRANTSANQVGDSPLEIHIFADIPKTLIFGKDGYSLMYN